MILESNTEVLRTSRLQAQSNSVLLYEALTGDLSELSYSTHEVTQENREGLFMSRFPIKEFRSEYTSYFNAKQRCRWKNDVSYKYYGAKGVEFRFVSFTEFMIELGPKPTKATGADKYTVDRKDVRGHYEKGNVQWLSLADQQKNKTNSIFFTYQNRTQCLSEWAKEVGMSRQNVLRRFRAGWCVPCILTVKPSRWGVNCSHG